MSPDPLDTLPSVCFIEDVARALRTSERTIRRARRHRVFPIPELPAVDKRPRWSGEEVRKFVNGQRVSLRRAG